MGGVDSKEGNVDVEMGGVDSKEGSDIMRVQTLGGRIKGPEDGDPVYMLAAFRGRRCPPLLLDVCLQ
jgi:DNA-directed RNA polymerase